jgi:thiol-disulfide isomerase/thioredoxin
MKKLILTLFLLILTKSFSQQNIRTNEKAKIKITDWILNVPQDKNIENKYIVLEFWASWCDPCLKSVKHINDLQSKFNREDLYFISITDEKVEDVKSVSKNINFKSIVVSDQRKYNYFWKNGIKSLILPLTILIDNKGIIKWIGMPSILTEKIIQDLIDNKLEPYNMYEIPK